MVFSLINLMTDHVNHLNDLGISAVNISALENEDEKRRVELGSY